MALHYAPRVTHKAHLCLPISVAVTYAGTTSLVELQRSSFNVLQHPLAQKKVYCP